MRDVFADIEAAFRRGNDPTPLRDVLRLLGSGQLRVMIGEHMTGSWRKDTGRVVHWAGDWDDAEARWMFDALQAETGGRWSWRGRRGWVRFMRGKGLI